MEMNPNVMCDMPCSQVEMGLASAHVVLTGGNMNIPFMKQRFERDLRQFVPDIYPIEVELPRLLTFSYIFLYVWLTLLLFL